MHEYAKLGVKNQVILIAMQRPNPTSAHYKGFTQFQKKLCKRIKELRKLHGYTQEDMTDFELSLRQYQRMEQDPSSITSLWQVYKLAQAFDITVDELLNC
jgi:DNA-binding XRE family transcriptional regulator